MFNVFGDINTPAQALQQSSPKKAYFSVTDFSENRGLKKMKRTKRKKQAVRSLSVTESSNPGVKVRHPIAPGSIRLKSKKKYDRMRSKRDLRRLLDDN